MMGTWPARIYGSAVVGLNWVRERGAAYRSAEQLQRRCNDRLREMVRYAVETIPYYSDLFRQLEMHPVDIQTAEDLARLPLIEKDVVRSQPERFRSNSRPGRTAIRFLTSGTTGEPLPVDHDRYSLLAKVAFDQRQRQVTQAILRKVDGLRTLLVGYDGCSADQWHAFLQANLFRRVRSEQRRLFGTEALDEVLDIINSYRPHIISAPGSYMEFLFRAATARRAKLHRPRLVEYYGQSISQDTRHLIKEQLGAAIHSFYGAIEAFNIGFTCEADTGFHLNTDLVHVRIVDVDGHDVPPGVKGEVVISNLVNHGTVLLNYRLGDTAALAPAPCPCGRTLPLLVGLEGRTEDAIYLPNGDFVFGRLIWSVFKRQHSVIRYQLIQHALDELELRLVTVDRATFERTKAQVIAELRTLLGESARIEPVYYTELGADARKFKPVISHLAERGTG
jgi:phenylacetate-CoA ligase